MVTALGEGVSTVWPRLVAGENGIGPISYFDPTQYSCRVAAEVRNFPSGDTGLHSLPPDHCRRTARLFLHAAREAHAEAGLEKAQLPAHRIGVAAGTTVNYLHMRMARHYFEFRQKESPYLDL